MDTEKTHKLADYQSPLYIIKNVQLFFEIIDFNEVKVKEILQVEPNPDTKKSSQDFLLDLTGNEAVQSISINGKTQKIKTNPEGQIVLTSSNKPFTVTATRTLNPSENKQGHGLYQSGDTLVTQNESIGFRSIMPFPDRPDISCTWTTTITAPNKEFPVVLATGDLKTKQQKDDKTTYTFVSNVAMPCYLYALVAGKFACVEDQLKTPEGKCIKLQIFCQPTDTPRVKLGMAALKYAINWDKETFDRNYPLDTYRIAVVDNFNAGAMENLGLNVFSKSSMIGDSKTTTDEGLLRIVRTVVHEYFHTWRGDMVTVRTWHEIALKEGLVNMTENLALESLTGKSVGRISDVQTLRAAQFTEDASTTAHSLLPKEYVGNPSNSLYTATTYEKGSEIFKMLKSFFGDEKFRAGMNHYFTKFLGKAATINELVTCFQETTGMNLKQFRLWFDQIGTPVCKVQSKYNEKKRELTLEISQSCPRKPHLTLQFPFAMGLIDTNGKEIKLELASKSSSGRSQGGVPPGVGGHDLSRGILNITKAKEKFIFKNIPKDTTPSVLRNFSAPLKLNFSYSIKQLLHLMKHDSDGFNRYEAGQIITKNCLEKLMKAAQHKKPLKVDDKVLNAYDEILAMSQENPSLAAEIMSLPDLMEMVQDMKVYDFEAAKKARDHLRLAIAKKYEKKLLKIYENQKEAGKISEKNEFTVIETMKNRKLKNISLYYLCALGEKYEKIAQKQFQSATTMTEEFMAFRLLCKSKKYREKALKEFYQKWKNDTVIVDRWRMTQAHLEGKDTLKRVKSLTEAKDFNLNNQGNVYYLIIFGFARNLICFHDKSGKGYKFITDILLKMENEEVASKLVKSAFNYLPKLDKHRQNLIKTQLKRIINFPKVLPGVKTKVLQILDK